MIKAAILIPVVFIVIGLFILWLLFFRDDKHKRNEKDGKTLYNDNNIKKIQTLIGKVEKENPEFVKSIREHLSVEAKLKITRESDPGDIGDVVKHWVNDKK